MTAGEEVLSEYTDLFYATVTCPFLSAAPEATYLFPHQPLPPLFSVPFTLLSYFPTLQLFLSKDLGTH